VAIHQFIIYSFSLALSKSPSIGGVWGGRASFIYRRVNTEVDLNDNYQTSSSVSHLLQHAKNYYC